MLKKMRWRFIGSAMAAFAAVVLTLLCAVNIWNYQNVTAQQDGMLAKLMELEDHKADFPHEQNGPLFHVFQDESPFSPEVQYTLRFFAVYYDADGAMLRTNLDYIASLSESDAQAYADKVIARGRMRGYEGGYRYNVRTLGDETEVLFLNSEREIQAMLFLRLMTLAIAAASLAVVFVLIVLFSRRAILPYLKNMEAQKQFITNASHELKTPLTAISTSADVLAMEHGDDEWIHNIQAQSVRLSRLIASLVTLSRLDEENPFPNRAEFSLSDAIWEICEPFASLARAKNRRYTQIIADGMMITGDRTAIQQMISILMDNALKYSPEDGEINLQAQIAGRRAKITVANSINSDLHIDTSRLFERFYRADESHSNAVNGTGIGLSIAAATVRAHDGKISASQIGDRIEFRVLLNLNATVRR